MQTLTIQVKDDFMSEVIKFIETAKDNIVVQKDKNLELDPYFYERQKDLQKILNDDKQIITHDELWNNVHKHLEKIQSN